MGRPRGRADKHRGIKGTQPPLVEICTNKRSLTQKIPMLEAGGGNCRIQRIQRLINKQQKTMQAGYKSAEQRKVERKRKIIPEENNGSSSILKTRKDNKKKAAAKFQDTHGGMMVERKNFCGTRVLRWQSLQRDRGRMSGQPYLRPFCERKDLCPTPLRKTSPLSSWTLTWMVRYITKSKDFTMQLRELQRQSGSARTSTRPP